MLHTFQKPSFLRRLSLNNNISYVLSGAVLFFTYLMWNIIQPYLGWEWDIDFLQTKQHIIHLDYYRYSFYLHIFSSLIILFCTAILLSKTILYKYVKWHKISGKIYVVLVLLISAPTGLLMAFHANGGFDTQLSFIILSPLWWYFTFMGYTTIRKGKVKKHKEWMFRSIALTLSAVTLRLAQMVLNTFWVLDQDLLYFSVSWGSWIVNLIIVEYLIWKRKVNNGHGDNGQLAI